MPAMRAFLIGDELVGHDSDPERVAVELIFEVQLVDHLGDVQREVEPLAAVLAVIKARVSEPEQGDGGGVRKDLDAAPRCRAP